MCLTCGYLGSNANTQRLHTWGRLLAFWLDVQVVNGTELVLTKPLGQAKGVVLLFHGCQHSALDWGYASPTCPLCLGEPYT